jgi:hypothetical protein
MNDRSFMTAVWREPARLFLRHINLSPGRARYQGGTMNAPDAPARASGRLAHLGWPFFGPAHRALRLVREVLAYYGAEGATEVQKLVIARELLQALPA